MKNTLLLTGVLLALTASLASAAPGLDMSWAGCPLTASNPTDVTDPCSDNGAQYFFYLAFKAPAGTSHVVAEDMLIDVQAASADLPDWWRLETGGCREQDFQMVSSRISFASTTTCKDYWGTSAPSGGFVWLPGTGGPNRTRMYATFARDITTGVALTPDVEYYAASGFFDTGHAIPDPTDPTYRVCQGCQIPACIVFNRLKLYQPAADADVPAIESANLRRHMTWQGGAVGTSCPGATATRRATWGQVKSLYR